MGTAPQRVAARAQHLMLDLAPRLFGYQWLMLCENADAPAAPSVNGSGKH